MRVLVTGHLGYLGTVMTPVLSEAGHSVAGLDSGLFADCILGAAPDDPPGIATDIRDVTAGQLAGFDAVIHLAALSNDPLGSLSPEITHRINHYASTRLARLSKRSGVRRFLYASTCSVYGSAGDEPVTEDAPLRPLTPYAESKVRVEDDLAMMADSHFSPVFLRNATAFGFSPRLRADIVLNDLVASAYTSGRVLVLSDGTPLRPLVHALDIAEAFSRALTAPTAAVHCAAFNVGDEANNLTVARIAEAAADAVPGAGIDITGETGADARSYHVDFSAIRRALPGYRAAWSAADGARQLYARYSEYAPTADDFRRRYTRLARLKDLQAAGVVDGAIHRRHVHASSA